MPYLICWDATNWEAGSVAPEGQITEEIVEKKVDAIRKVQEWAANGRSVAHHDVEIILSSPDDFEFSSGYDYYAFAVQVGPKVTSVDGAWDWLRSQTENGVEYEPKFVAFMGGSFNPPDGAESPMTEEQIVQQLEGLLE
jgi:hypothetical protein